MRVRNLMLLFVVGVACPTAAQPASTSPAGAEIDRLMDLTGTSTLGAQAASLVFNQMLSDLVRTQPNVPERAVTGVKDVIRRELEVAFLAPELRAKQAALLAERFTAEDVRQLIAFYATPAGQKMVAMLPSLLDAGMAAGQDWLTANVAHVGALIEQRFRADEVIR